MFPESINAKGILHTMCNGIELLRRLTRTLLHRSGGNGLLVCIKRLPMGQHKFPFTCKLLTNESIFAKACVQPPNQENLISSNPMFNIGMHQYAFIRIYAYMPSTYHEDIVCAIYRSGWSTKIMPLNRLHKLEPAIRGTISTHGFFITAITNGGQGAFNQLKLSPP